VSDPHLVPLDPPAIFAFSGPDAERFLNGQITQDVRLLSKRDVALPACVTDAKGRLQFRVRLLKADDGAIWVEAASDQAEALEARLTRYLIADDVEVEELTEKWHPVHFTGIMPDPPSAVFARKSNRFGVDGTDWWVPAGTDQEILPVLELLSGDELDAFRIERGAPVWGKELIEGMLPPEAGLEGSDISYQKGCYIGQEVISRIKSAGKVNRRLWRMSLPGEGDVSHGMLFDAGDNEAGVVTSISPIIVNGARPALGYLKRGAATEGLWMNGPGGPVECLLISPSGT